MNEDPQELSSPEILKLFQVRFPEVWKNYREVRDACDAAGPLEPKVRELIKVAVSTARRRHGGLIAHIDRARSLGASPEEIYQAILLNLPLLGFPDTLAGFKIASQHLQE